MILSDTDIKKLVKEHKLIHPFSPNALNPTDSHRLSGASYDLSFHPLIYIERKLNPIERLKLKMFPTHEFIHSLNQRRWIKQYLPDTGFFLKPKQFILGGVQEELNLPDNIAAEFRLKSTLGRQGLQHALAVWIDPGYLAGRPTVELTNLSEWIPIPLCPNQLILQVIFHTCTGTVERPYTQTGRYAGDKQPSPAKPPKYLSALYQSQGLY